jgi:branched-chain amino acid transport system ATP-binding protein
LLLSFLRTEGVSVRFGGVAALTEVSVSAAAGEVTGLIGPNGAGKTTLFNVITGLQDLTRGCVMIDGRDVTTTSTHRRARLGMARTFQRLEVFGSLTVRENVLVAAEIRRRWSRDHSDPKAITDGLLERVGLQGVVEARVDSLPTGQARLVELARALATRPRVLLLDEPGSGLDARETEAFARLLLDLAGDGLAVLLVEHDVELVMRVCARIHVLDFGVKIAEGTPAEIQSDGRVQAAYLGEGDEVTAMENPPDREGDPSSALD